ncbi:MAG: hypothetical protein P9X24_06665 [Candidatus Hatepunaea meridiana]|nr:hypothetical protein [Candidatus Hatepunaea meridiana]
MKHINNIVGITLVIVFVLIQIHDIQPLVIDTHGKDKSVPVSTETQTSHHSDGCDASCPCVIHVLEKSLGFSQFQNENLVVTSTVRLTKDPMPESIIPKPIDHPPEA